MVFPVRRWTRVARWNLRFGRQGAAAKFLFGLPPSRYGAIDP